MVKGVDDAQVLMDLALEAAHVGTFHWIVGEPSLKYSERLAQIFGLTGPDLSHGDFTAVIFPEDQPVRMAAHEKAIKSGILSYEARVTWPDRSIHWVRINGKVMYNSKHEPIRLLGVGFDMTGEKLQRQNFEQTTENYSQTARDKAQDIKESEERYHKMIDEVEDYAIILLDRSGIIQNWNRGAQKIKGYQQSEIVGKSFKVFYLPEDRKDKLPERLIDEAARNGRAVHEGWRLRKDGTKFWGSITITALHNEGGNVIGFSKVTRDLTERKLASDKAIQATEEIIRRNEELRHSEERYHKMVSEVQDYAIILLDENGKIQNWNAGAEKIKGYTENEIIGKSFEIFYTKEDQERGFPFTFLREAARAGRASHEGWRVRKNGTKFWGSIVLTALHAADDHVIGFSKVTRDLTERKIAEDKLLQNNAELEAQNRELEQFAYVASHDLQEPLRKIQTFSDIILRNKDDASTEKYFEKIQVAASRMSELIKAVLNYSRLSKDAEEKVKVDLNDVLAHVKSDYELLIQEKRAAVASDPLPHIKGYPLQIGQLFSNLIGNALKFSTEAPVVKITWRTVSPDQIPNKPDALHASRYYELKFTDNGIGFEQEYEDRIFMMFQRLHGRQQYAGTGIGLALCKKIADLHEGLITAKSDLGKGSVFLVYLPVE